MSTETDIAGHYRSGSLLQRLRAALESDGADPDHPSIDELAPYDHFHGRGMEATQALLGALDLAPGDHVLDVGSGLGGPARYLANRFGCRVSGIDLTDEFCAVARHLNALLEFEDRVSFRHGNALDMPFEASTFDGAYSMNVSMNIADRPRLYSEFHRVLRPGAWLLLSEIAQGPNGEVRYPTPWARTASSSFLLTPEQTRAGLEAAGLEVLALTDTTQENVTSRARARAIVDAGGKPPHRGIQLIHGGLAREIMETDPHSVEQRRTVPIVVSCRKPDAGESPRSKR